MAPLTTSKPSSRSPPIAASPSARPPTAPDPARRLAPTPFVAGRPQRGLREVLSGTGPLLDLLPSVRRRWQRRRKSILAPRATVLRGPVDRRRPAHAEEKARSPGLRCSANQLSVQAGHRAFRLPVRERQLPGCKAGCSRALRHRVGRLEGGQRTCRGKQGQCTPYASLLSSLPLSAFFGTRPSRSTALTADTQSIPIASRVS